VKPGQRAVTEHIGRKLREHRQASGWSQKELAANAGVSPSTVAALEAGRRGSKISTLLFLCVALDITVEDLLAGTEWQPREGGGKWVVVGGDS
jgi:transcriptional regulator with XRE-family HTH domain